MAATYYASGGMKFIDEEIGEYTDLVAWRVQGLGVEASVGNVIKDTTTKQNVYVISLRLYSTQRTWQRETTKKRRE